MEGPRVLARVSDFLYRHTVLVLAVLFALGAGALLWQQDRSQEDLVRMKAIEDAGAYAHVLAAFRSLYTSEVVERVRPHGVAVTHDYKEHPGAIPLPATLSMMLGGSMAGSDVRSRLYSPYPFPWRTDGGLRDDFARDAWEALRRDPGGAFSRVEEIGGVLSLRRKARAVTKPPMNRPPQVVEEVGGQADNIAT